MRCTFALASSSKGPEVGKDLAALPQVAAVLSADGRPIASGKDVDGNAVLTTATSAPNLGWHVFYEQPTSQALSPIRDQLVRIALLIALGKVPGATGLDWNAAFAAITSVPAEAVGLGGDIGSLKPGRQGDVVIWSGDPLELDSAALSVWISGVKQPLQTRQALLLKRYLQPQEGALPKAYER